MPPKMGGDHPPKASGPPFGLLRRRAAAPGPCGLAVPRPLRGGSPWLLAVQKRVKIFKKAPQAKASEARQCLCSGGGVLPRYRAAAVHLGWAAGLCTAGTDHSALALFNAQIIRRNLLESLCGRSA